MKNKIIDILIVLGLIFTWVNTASLVAVAVVAVILYAAWFNKEIKVAVVSFKLPFKIEYKGAQQ